MNIEAKLWAGSHVQMLCDHEPDELKRMAIVARKIERFYEGDDLTKDEIELRDALETWLAERNAEYE